MTVKLHRPLLIATHISLLSLGVSALPFQAHAQEADRNAWTWGVAARDAERIPDAVLVDFRARDKGQAGGSGGIGTLAVGLTGLGVTIAILDTGIDLDHPEFAGRIDPDGTCFGIACGSALGDDDNGHGSHVAGIAAAADDATGNTGVAPDATLLSVKVLAASGSGSYADLALGISYAATQGARVLNMSLGGPRPSTAEGNAVIAALRTAAETSVIVVAAGNDGNGRIPAYPAAYATQPGIGGSMIIVGSVKANLTNISRFSNLPNNEGCAGPRGARYCFKDVFLVAPGENINSTLPGGTYGSYTGTSMAAPYVAGAAALVFEGAPYLTPQEVANILFTSAIDLGRPGTDGIYGRGLVNPVGAIAPLGSLSIATSGASTKGRTGTGNLRVSGLGGVLANGLRGSQAAHDLVFFDQFNRDYRVDLTESISSAAASLAGAIAQSGPSLRTVTFLGDDYSASALVGDEATNMVAFAGGDVRAHVLRDAVITARLSEDASLTVGYNAGVEGRLNQLDLAASEAFDGLFISATALNSPYLAFAGEASLIGAAVALDGEVSLSVGHVTQDEKRDGAFEDEALTIEENIARVRTDDTHLASGEGSAASIAWRFAPWGLAGFNVAYTDERNALFGGYEAGALALTGDAQTTSAGAGVRINLGDNWVGSASWSMGVSEVTSMAGGLFANISELRTTAYGVALAKRGLFGAGDAIGFGVSRPLHVVDGSAVFVASTGVTKARDIIYSTETINLASATPETDFEIGYTAQLSRDVSFQANAIYQLNLGGVAGSDAIAGLATVKTVW